MPERVVVDASVLIALEKIDLLPLLCDIYREVIIPESVLKEFGSINIKCYSERKIESGLTNLLMRDLNLGRGEAEVIAFSYESGVTAMIDDGKARKVAGDMGLNISGTIGMLLRAEKMGLIKSAYDKVKDLKAKGFYVSDEILAKLSRP